MHTTLVTKVDYSFWEPGECDKKKFALSLHLTDLKCYDDETFQYEGGIKCRKALQEAADLYCGPEEKGFLVSMHNFFYATKDFGNPVMCRVSCTGLYMCVDPKKIVSTTPTSAEATTYPVSAEPTSL